MPIEGKGKGENIIFEDYNNREVTINWDEYLKLISVKERQTIRPFLDECLKNPTEVWWNIEVHEGSEYSFYKYIKMYSDYIIVALVLVDDIMNFKLNNFYGYGEGEFHLADQERKGQLIKSDRSPRAK